MISLVISLTTTPMMCACLLRPRGGTASRPRRSRADASAASMRMRDVYGRTLRLGAATIRAGHDRAGGIVALNVYLFVDRAQGLLPAAGHRSLKGGLRADQSISFQAMAAEAATSSWTSCSTTRRSQTVVGFTAAAARRANSGIMFIGLKPLSQRKIERDQRDRAAAAQAGAGHRRAAVPAGRAGPAHRAARSSNCAVPVHLQTDNLADLPHLGAASSPRRCKSVPTAHRRRHRPAGQRLRDRPRRSIAATAARLGLNLARCRQRALRRLRPAPGLDDLRRHQPVPRGHGGRAAVLAEPGDAARTSMSAPAAARSTAARSDQRRRRGAFRRTRHQRAGRQPAPSANSTAAQNLALEPAHQQRSRQRLDRRRGQHR